MPQIIRFAGCALVISAVFGIGSSQLRAALDPKSVVPIQQAQPSVAADLDTRAIEEAINWGLGKFPDRGIPEAYALAPYSGRSPQSTLGSVGAQPVRQQALIITPFMRVALAAGAAADRHEGFTPRDVTADMTDPLVWVAAFAYDPFPGSSRPTADRLFDVREIVTAASSGRDRSFELILHRPEERMTAPAWTERLDRIGKALKIKVTARGAVAAFPREALVPGRDLVVMFSQRDYIPSEPAWPHYSGMRIPIRQRDVSSWR
jgi:hypothetical protein